MGEAPGYRPAMDARLAELLWPHQVERLEIVPAALGSTLPERAGLAVALGDVDGEGAGEGTGGSA